MPTPKHPALTYALRGITGFEITLHGPARDLHSGIFGGTVDNPAMALCQLLGKLRDKNGRVAIPGFYDDVQPLSAYERKQFARLPFNASDYRKFLGVPKLFGERGFTPHRTALRPADLRDQRPDQRLPGRRQQDHRAGLGARQDHRPAGAEPETRTASKRVRQHLEKLCPPTVRLEIKSGHGAEAYLVSPTGPQAQAALARAEAGLRL